MRFKAVTPLPPTDPAIAQALATMEWISENMDEAVSILKKIKRPPLTINPSSCYEFVKLVADEVDRAFPPGATEFDYLRNVLIHIRGTHEENRVTPSVISAIIDVYANNTSRMRTADLLADHLLALHRMLQNDIKVDRRTLEGYAREARDAAEGVGLPDMSTINAYFVLLFR